MANKIATYNFVNQLLGASSLTGNRCVTKSVLIANWNADESLLADYADNQLVKEEHIASGFVIPEEDLIYYCDYSTAYNVPEPIIDLWGLGKIISSDGTYFQNALIIRENSNASMIDQLSDKFELTKIKNNEYIAIKINVDNNQITWNNYTEYLKVFSGFIGVANIEINGVDVTCILTIYFANYDNKPYLAIGVYKTTDGNCTYNLHKINDLIYLRWIKDYYWILNNNFDITFKINGEFTYKFNLKDKVNNVGTLKGCLIMPVYGAYESQIVFDASQYQHSILSIVYVNNLKMYSNIKQTLTPIFHVDYASSPNDKISGYAPTGISKDSTGDYYCGSANCYYTINKLSRIPESGTISIVFKVKSLNSTRAFLCGWHGDLGYIWPNYRQYDDDGDDMGIFSYIANGYAASGGNRQWPRGACSSVNIKDDKWHHLVFTWGNWNKTASHNDLLGIYDDNTSPRECFVIYIDGVNKTASQYNNMWKPTSPKSGYVNKHRQFFVGGSSTHEYTLGWVRDVRLYDTNLTAEQVKLLYEEVKSKLS